MQDDKKRKPASPSPSMIPGGSPASFNPNNGSRVGEMLPPPPLVRTPQNPSSNQGSPNFPTASTPQSKPAQPIPAPSSIQSAQNPKGNKGSGKKKGNNGVKRERSESVVNAPPNSAPTPQADSPSTSAPPVPSSMTFPTSSTSSSTTLTAPVTLSALNGDISSSTPTPNNGSNSQNDNNPPPMPSPPPSSAFDAGSDISKLLGEDTWTFSSTHGLGSETFDLSSTGFGDGGFMDFFGSMDGAGNDMNESWMLGTGTGIGE
jgi:hypothetical protein